MLRKLTLFAMFAVAAPMITGSEAHAASKEELAAQKDDVKEAKATAKSVAKIAKKWNKSHEKGKDTKELEKELKPYLKAELASLKEQGVTGPEPEVHPSELKDKTYREGAEPEPAESKPKLEELHNIVSSLKSGEVKPKRYGELLNQYAERLEQRYERKSNRYKEAKKAS